MMGVCGHYTVIGCPSSTQKGQCSGCSISLHLIHTLSLMYLKINLGLFVVVVFFESIKCFVFFENISFPFHF